MICSVVRSFLRAIGIQSNCSNQCCASIYLDCNNLRKPSILFVTTRPLIIQDRCIKLHTLTRLEFLPEIGVAIWIIFVVQELLSVLQEVSTDNCDQALSWLQLDIAHGFLISEYEELPIRGVHDFFVQPFRPHSTHSRHLRATYQWVCSGVRSTQSRRIWFWLFSSLLHPSSRPRWQLSWTSPPGRCLNLGWNIDARFFRARTLMRWNLLESCRYYEQRRNPILLSRIERCSRGWDQLLVCYDRKEFCLFSLGSVSWHLQVNTSTALDCVQSERVSEVFPYVFGQE